MYYYDLAEAAAKEAMESRSEPLAAQTEPPQQQTTEQPQSQSNGMANGVSELVVNVKSDIDGSGNAIAKANETGSGTGTGSGNAITVTGSANPAGPPPASAPLVSGPTPPPPSTSASAPPPPASQPQPQTPQSQPPAPAIGTFYTQARSRQQRPSAPLPVPAPVPAAQPVHFARRPSMPYGKVAIVEPPGAARQALTNAFASPTRDHSRDNPKFSEDLSRLTYAIQQSVPEAVRRATRDHWEKALLGTEFHQAFIMNAVIHHANGLIIRRAIRDFGGKMVSESKHELIGHFRARDFDEVADEILSRVSDDFLDKAMERRLATIDARSLINALARAERLGYENNDITEEEAVPPQPQYQAQYAPQPQATQVQPPPAPAPAPAPVPSQYTQNGPRQGATPQTLQCPMCWRKFTSAAPYEYHVKKQLCTKPPPNAQGFPFSCSHCGAGFITNVGQQYHLANEVCGDHGTSPATPRAAEVPNSPAMISGANSPAVPQGTPQSGPVVYQYQPSQNHRSAPGQHQSYVGTPPSATQYSAGLSSDPYAHLTPITRARMNEDLRRAEEAYAPRFKEAEAIADPNERKNRVDALQNSFSTKQSNIRKRYGVRLRHRRTKEEIEAERVRMTGHPGLGPSLKRQRTDDGGGDSPAYVSTQQAASSQPSSMPTPMDIDTPSKHLTVSDIKSEGLGGSSATAAMADPTLNLTQDTPSRPTTSRNSLSSYQRNGHRTDIHVPKTMHRASQEQDAKSVGSSSTTAEQRVKRQSPTALTQTQTSVSKDPRSGSATDPIALDDDNSSSDSDSDSDAEIPAKLPPGRKASGTPQKGLAG